MVTYLIEIFELVKEGNYKYFHLADSKIFQSEKILKDRSYYKNGKNIVLSRI